MEFRRFEMGKSIHIVSNEKPSGFFMRIFDGTFAPITILMSIIDPELNVYNINNNGGYYYLGFLIGFINFYRMTRS